MAATGKVWLCGPFRDLAPFEAAELSLRQAGIVPCYGPHDLPATADPDAAARARIARMMDCESVCLLDGWSSDAVADFEHTVAKRVGMRCVPLVILLSAGG